MRAQSSNALNILCNIYLGYRCPELVVDNKIEGILRRLTFSRTTSSTSLHVVSPPYVALHRTVTNIKYGIRMNCCMYSLHHSPQTPTALYPDPTRTRIYPDHSCRRHCRYQSQSPCIKYKDSY